MYRWPSTDVAARVRSRSSPRWWCCRRWCRRSKSGQPARHWCCSTRRRWVWPTIAGPALDGCRTGITYQQAAAHDSANPSDPWILKDSAGKPITQNPYAGTSTWRTSVRRPTSSSGRRTWSVPTKRLGYNGTTLDNVSANVSAWAPGRRLPDAVPLRQRLGDGDEELHRLRRAAAEGAGAVRARERGQARPQRWLRDQGLVDDARALRQRLPGRVLRARRLRPGPVLQRPDQLARLLAELARSRRRRPERRRRLLRRHAGALPPTPTR